MYRRARIAWPAVPNSLPEVPEARKARVAERDELVLIHDRSRTIPEVLDRALRYAPIQAQAMLDRGQVFSARAMLSALGRRAWSQFVLGRAWRDGLPGLLRAAILVNFHFYVWAAFWQLSGARRTPEDDRYVEKLGRRIEAARRAWRGAAFPYRLGKRLAGRLRARRR
jgi:hypothetical protein